MYEGPERQAGFAACAARTSLHEHGERGGHGAWRDTQATILGLEAMT
jgi:hypothetical protein